MTHNQSLAQIVRRLARMSPHEMCVRAKQEVDKRLDFIIYRLGFEPKVQAPTIGDLAPSRFFFTAAEIPEILDLWRRHLPDEVERTIEAAERICRHEFDLLGFRGLHYGSEIDWHLDAVHGTRAPLERWYRVERMNLELSDRKVIWELNRHHHFVTLSKVYLLTREKRFLTELISQWRHWQKSNPYPYGINWASSLEVAFRSLSWLWVDALLRGQPATPLDFLNELRIAQCLNARHITRYLSTYSAPNTHLLGEVVALFFLGTFYPSFPGAIHWRSEGWRLTQEQAARQVRPDGFHFEQSTYYHVYALDFFLHAMLLAQRNAATVDESFERVVTKMLDILAKISQAGVPLRMGDDDGGRVFDPRRNSNEHMLDPLCIGAAIFRRSDWKAFAPGLTEECLWLLGPNHCNEFLELWPDADGAASQEFSSSGIHVMVSKGREVWQLGIDAGPQGTGTCGHGHADALSVQLSGANREWLIDTGTYTYGEAIGRERFRRTAAHNTLQAGDRSQADPVQPFAWTNIPAISAERWVSAAEWDYFSGAHTGYQRLRNAVLHRRSVVRVGDLWLLRDQALGNDPYAELLISWHFASDLNVSKKSMFSVLARDQKGRSLTLRVAANDVWQMSLEKGEWSPIYGVALPIPVVRFRCKARLPVELLTVLLPEDLDIELSQPDALRASVYDLLLSEVSYRFVFGSGHWRVGELSGNEEFALFCANRPDEYRMIGSVAKPAPSSNGRL